MVTSIRSIDVMGSNLLVEFQIIKQHRLTVESAYFSVGRHISTRVDEGRKS